jgi:hypothetical protein
MQRKMLVALFTVGLGLLVWASALSAAGDQYRRWLDDGKTVMCSGGMTLTYSNQNIEFANLPVDAQFTINYLRNGVLEIIDGPYVVEQTTGTLNYNALLISGSFPLTYAVRLDTLINGVVVYESTMSGTCTADGPGTISLTNVAVNAATPGSAAAICAVSYPEGSTQGRLTESVVALYEPLAEATTTIVLPAGTAWWIMDAQDGFYQLWIACNASPVWVPVAMMAPNQDPPWNGAPLPPA